MLSHRSFNTLFIDLDDTVYPANIGLWDAISARMDLYMHEIVGIPTDDIPLKRSNYYQTYGTTMRGLIEDYSVDPGDYLRYVHDLPLHDYLQPDLVLKGILDSLPQPKWIFTNADKLHASRVLSTLGLSDCFKGIIDVHIMDFDCKPFPQVYQRAIEIADANKPEFCVLIDDAHRNLKTAKELGFFTVLIGQNNELDSAHIAIEQLADLPAEFPELWE